MPFWGLPLWIPFSQPKLITLCGAVLLLLIANDLCEVVWCCIAFGNKYAALSIAFLTIWVMASLLQFSNHTPGKDTHLISG